MRQRNVFDFILFMYFFMPRPLYLNTGFHLVRTLDTLPSKGHRGQDTLGLRAGPGSGAAAVPGPGIRSGGASFLAAWPGGREAAWRSPRVTRVCPTPTSPLAPECQPHLETSPCSACFLSAGHLLINLVTLGWAEMAERVERREFVTFSGNSLELWVEKSRGEGRSRGPGVFCWNRTWDVCGGPGLLGVGAAGLFLPFHSLPAQQGWGTALARVSLSRALCWCLPDAGRFPT